MPLTAHPVFESIEETQILWRFMKIERLEDLIQRKSLFFANLERLTNDPWEGMPPPACFDPKREIEVSVVPSASNLDLRALQRRYRTTLGDFHGGPDKYRKAVNAQINGYEQIRGELFVNCWHMSDSESETLWRIYCPESTGGIAVRTTFKRLSQAVTDTMSIYAGKVTYLDEQTDSIPDGNLYRYSLWKRRAFEHEKEFRLLTHQPEKVGESGILVTIDLAQLIEEIIITPYADKAFLQRTQRLLGLHGLTAPVTQSRLLTKPDYNERV